MPGDKEGEGAGQSGEGRLIRCVLQLKNGLDAPVAGSQLDAATNYRGMARRDITDKPMESETHDAQPDQTLQSSKVTHIIARLKATMPRWESGTRPWSMTSHKTMGMAAAFEAPKCTMYNNPTTVGMICSQRLPFPL